MINYQILFVEFAVPLPNSEYPMNFNIDTSQLSPAPDNIDTSDITGLGLELNENDLRIGSDDEHLNDMYDEEAHELSNILPNLPMDINVLLGKSGFFYLADNCLFLLSVHPAIHHKEVTHFICSFNHMTLKVKDKKSRLFFAKFLVENILIYFQTFIR